MPLARWSFTTRLETRTKESTKCASVLVTNQTTRNESDACELPLPRLGSATGLGSDRM